MDIKGVLNLLEDRLKGLRQERNLNMRQVARALNMPYTTYVGYEKNERSVNSETLVLLANFFDCSVDYLLGRTSEVKTEKDKKIIAPIDTEDDNKQKLLSNYDKLNDDGQSKLLDYSADLVSGGRYVKNNQLFGAKEA